MNAHIIIMLVMIFASAILSGMEISMAALSPFHYQKKYKEKITFLLRKKDSIISTLLIGNNICLVTATIALDNLLPRSLNTYSRLGAFLLQILLFFFLAELLPKNIFRKLNSWIVVKLYFVIIIIYYILFPLSWFFAIFSSYFFRFIPESKQVKKEDIVHFIRKQFTREKRPITQGLSSLGKTRALEVMTPTPEVFSVNSDSNIKEALLVIKGTSYSRYPVYESRGDNLVGYIKIFDLLNARPTESIKKYMYDPIYVPESLPIDKVLHKMQKEIFQMVFVVNEYGSVTGIITLENIAEEIIGSDILAREQITEKPYIVKINESTFELDGNLDIDDFNEMFELNIEKKGFETITGYIINVYGDIPEKGTKIATNFGSLLIRNANKKTILSIQFSLISKKDNMAK